MKKFSIDIPPDATGFKRVLWCSKRPCARTAASFCRLSEHDQLQTPDERGGITRGGMHRVLALCQRDTLVSKTQWGASRGCSGTKRWFCCNLVRKYNPTNDGARLCRNVLGQVGPDGLARGGVEARAALAPVREELG